MTRFIRFKFHRLCLIFTLLVATVGCDQITKVIARDTLSSSGSLHYLNNAIVLVHAENPGAFMSAGAGLHNHLRFLLFVIFSGALVLGAFYYLLRNKLSRWWTVTFVLFVGGSIGNLIDRMDRSTVTDFINLGLGSWRTGIFNIADVAIVASVLILIFSSSKRPVKNSQTS